MGYLRSCYSTQARFFYDADIEVPIVWYFADPSAPRFSGRHSFAPITFSERASWANPGVGESVSASRPWRDGSIPLASTTNIADGEARWYEVGQMTTDPGLLRTPFGIPVNCAGPPVGAYCLLTVAQDYNFLLRRPSGALLGRVVFEPGTSGWGVFDLDGNFAGNMTCVVYPATPSDFFNIQLVTNLITGSPGVYYAFRYFEYDNPTKLVTSIGGTDVQDAELTIDF
jgi:hypothetical protein